MSVRIVADSCCDLPEALKQDPRFVIVPLTIEVGGEHVIDDESFNQQELLRLIAASSEPARTACPSPDAYMKTFDCEADDIFVVTLSSKLSGSYNSAILGRDMYLEEHPGRHIHVVDSLSACCGETQMALRIRDEYEKNRSFEEVIETVNHYRDEMNTYFVLDNLDTLRKNGRLTGLKSLMASTLNIKPVCASDRGEIIQKGQGIGSRKAFIKMVEFIQKEVKNPEEKRVMITHVNCYERAMTVMDLILARMNFKDAIVVEAAGVATTYANDGGIVVTA